MPNPDNSDIFNKVPPLLIGETVEEFERLRAELEQEIRPKGIIERYYLDQVLAVMWEIFRLQRLKTYLIHIARIGALEMLLLRIDISLAGLIGKNFKSEAQRLVAGWLENNSDKEFVLKILAGAGLDESAIDAEAIRRCYKDLLQIDNMLGSYEARFDKALRRISKYRKSLAQQIRSSADQILARADVKPANDRSAA